MPFKEAFFWVALTVLGAGLYFILDHPVLAVVLILVGAYGVWWSVYLHHHPRSRQRYVWVLLLLLTWAAIGFDYYARVRARPIPEFDENQSAMVIEYGFAGDSCYMVVDGTALKSRQRGYKQAIGCFIYDGKEDQLDAPYLQVSNLYDIGDAKVRMIEDYKPYFNQYRRDMNAYGIDIALLNVPNGVEPSQFTTLRQARALGVKIPTLVAAMSTKPSGTP